MEQKKIDLKDSAGFITFDEHPADFRLERTAKGINLTIPALINLRWPDRTKPRPMLTNFRVAIYSKTSPGEGLEIGRARDDDYYEGSTPGADKPAELIWEDALHALLLVERNRSGRQPQFELSVRGELSFIVKCVEYTEENYMSRDRPKVHDVRTSPYERVSERLTVSYQTDVWERMIKRALDLSQDDLSLMLLPLTPFLAGRQK